MKESSLINRMESCKWFGTAACPYKDKMKTIGVSAERLGEEESKLPTAQEFVEEMCSDAEFCENCPKYTRIDY